MMINLTYYKVRVSWGIGILQVESKIEFEYFSLSLFFFFALGPCCVWFSRSDESKITRNVTREQEKENGPGNIQDQEI